MDQITRFFDTKIDDRLMRLGFDMSKTAIDQRLLKPFEPR